MLDRDCFLRLACLPIAAALIAACSSNPPIVLMEDDGPAAGKPGGSGTI